jgi:hypothetical protein
MQNPVEEEKKVSCHKLKAQPLWACIVCRINKERAMGETP